MITIIKPVPLYVSQADYHGCVIRTTFTVFSLFVILFCVRRCGFRPSKRTAKRVYSEARRTRYLMVRGMKVIRKCEKKVSFGELQDFCSLWLDCRIALWGVSHGAKTLSMQETTERQIRIPRIHPMFGLPLADDRAPMPTNGKIGPLYPGMYTGSLLHFSDRGFVVMVQKRMLVDPAWCKCPRCPQRIIKD